MLEILVQDWSVRMNSMRSKHHRAAGWGPVERLHIHQVCRLSVHEKKSDE